jgi:hypothetical protein
VPVPGRTPQLWIDTASSTRVAEFAPFLREITSRYFSASALTAGAVVNQKNISGMSVDLLPVVRVSTCSTISNRLAGVLKLRKADLRWR